MRHDCDGNPSITNYGRGCRCELCRKYKAENPEKEMPKKPAGKRDNPVVYADAFTREEIMRARNISYVPDREYGGEA